MRMKLTPQARMAEISSVRAIAFNEVIVPSSTAKGRASPNSAGRRSIA